MGGGGGGSYILKVPLFLYKMRTKGRVHSFLRAYNMDNPLRIRIYSHLL